MTNIHDKQPWQTSMTNIHDKHISNIHDKSPWQISVCLKITWDLTFVWILDIYDGYIQYIEFAQNFKNSPWQLHVSACQRVEVGEPVVADTLLLRWTQNYKWCQRGVFKKQYPLLEQPIHPWIMIHNHSILSSHLSASQHLLLVTTRRIADGFREVQLQNFKTAKLHNFKTLIKLMGQI